MPIVNGEQVGLLEFSKNFRNRELARNKFTSNSEYNAAHPNAISDGDENGKGENNGSVGSKTDIAQRGSQLAKNRYTKDNQYDSSKI